MSKKINWNKRDRRKAKQSSWTRAGKCNPKLKGHGGNGMSGIRYWGK